jgi:hypothetical protein
VGYVKGVGYVKKDYGTLFREGAKLVHGDRYDYSLVGVVRSNVSITIRCSVHGEFSVKVRDHLNGVGCSICSKGDMFCAKAVAIHGDKYDYSLVEYINSSTKVKIICPIHGEFGQTPNSHGNQGRGCYSCSRSRKLTVDEFIVNAKLVHGDRYDYSKVEYINWKTSVIVVCPEHGEFSVRPNTHVSGGVGCLLCSYRVGWSIKCARWLSSIMVRDGIDIVCINEDGIGFEYVVPGTNYRADGYCKETNTIYEFYGDYWHGNPHVFEYSDWNEVKGCSMGYLYEKTKAREEEILALGYKLVVMWESDYLVEL